MHSPQQNQWVTGCRQRFTVEDPPLSDLAGLVRRSNPSEAVVAPRDLNSAQHPPAPLAPGQPDIPDRFASRSAHEVWYKSVYLIILYRALEAGRNIFWNVTFMCVMQYWCIYLWT